MIHFIQPREIKNVKLFPKIKMDTQHVFEAIHVQTKVFYNKISGKLDTQRQISCIYVQQPPKSWTQNTHFTIQMSNPYKKPEAITDFGPINSI